MNAPDINRLDSHLGNFHLDNSHLDNIHLANRHRSDNNRPELWALGYCCLDRTVFPDKTVTENSGGGAWWAGQAARTHYSPTKILAAVGDDWPATQVLPGMVCKDLPTTQVELRYLSPTDWTARTIQIQPGASHHFSPNDVDPQSWWAVQYCLLSTMLPSQQTLFLHALREYAPQAKIAMDSDSLFVNDPLQRAKVVDNFQHSDLVFMNRHEAQVLADIIPTLPLVIIKADAAGAALVSYGHETAFVPAPPIVAQDATGAGDVLAGTLLARVMLGYDLLTALSLAVTRASQFVAGDRGFAR